MRSVPRWIVIDLAGAHLAPGADLMIHSASGVPIEKTLRRAISSRKNSSPLLDMDREAAHVLVDYIDALDVKAPRDTETKVGGLHFAHHFVQHPDYGVLAVAVWMHTTPSPPCPTINSWVLDLDQLNTVSAGDDLSLLGDGREAGEARPVTDLWRFLDPSDAARLVMRYSDALNSAPGTWMSLEWTTHIPGFSDQHFFSGGRLFVEGERRVIAGTSIVLPERRQTGFETLAPLAAFTGATIALVNWNAKAALTSIGTDAPLSNDSLRTLVNVPELSDGSERHVNLDGIEFVAQSLPLTQDKHDTALIMLRRTENANSEHPPEAV